MSSYPLEHASFKGKLPDEDAYVFVFDRSLAHLPNGTSWATKHQILSVSDWHSADPQNVGRICTKDAATKLVLSFVPFDDVSDIG